ncbi:protein of unknown function [Aeromonas sp. RU39B]|nr:protein of unknown function [Aeromonas sp. RU39B]
MATGPISQDGLREKLLSGEISSDCLVWHEGLESWCRIDTFTELSFMPPPLPVRDVNHESEKKELVRHQAASNPSPWRRFFARTFDMAWVTLVLFLLFEMLAKKLITNGTISQQASLNNLYIIFILAAQPIAMLIDAIVTATLGSSIGKLLLGIEVKRIDGSKPNLTSIISRNMSVLASGMGFSIPLITLITNAYQFHSLKKRGVTSYDSNKFDVVCDDKYKLSLFLTLTVILILSYAFYSRGTSHLDNYAKFSNYNYKADEQWYRSSPIVLSEAAQSELKGIESFSKNLPKDIGGDARYDSFFIDDRKNINMRFTMMEIDPNQIDGKFFYETVRPKEVVNACNGYRNLLSEGFNIYLVYSDKTGGPISSIYISISDCKR